MTGREILSLKGHIGPVTCVAVSPDGKHIVSSSNPWDYGVQVKPGEEVPGEVKVWDAVSGQETPTFKEHTGAVLSLVFRGDHNHLASASDGRYQPGVGLMQGNPGSSEVVVWDGATGQQTLTLKVDSVRFTCAAFSPDGERLVTGSGGFGPAATKGEVKIWDALTGQVIRILKGHTGMVTSVAFSPDGKSLVSSGGANDAKDQSVTSEVKVWNAATGQEIFTLKEPAGWVNRLAFSPDSKHLVSANLGGHAMDRSGGVKVWDAATGQELLALNGHTAVAFSPDGKRLACSSDAGTLKVWDAATGQEILTLKGHTRGVACVAFSPDGKRLVSGSWDQTVKVWDATTGQDTLTLKGHTDGVSSVAFSPDGKRLVSGSQSGIVKVWEAHLRQERPR